MLNYKKKTNIDYSAPHNRQMYFRMRLLRFYKKIESDDDIYVRTAKMILSGTLPYRHMNQIEKLRREHETRQKEKYSKIEKKGATSIEYQIRKVVNSFSSKI
jgi:hypothetical protein|tara:strand:+ start:551 stop:856 length:306 start_codon:yes stop_codon:yes gene_type:complete